MYQTLAYLQILWLIARIGAVSCTRALRNTIRWGWHTVSPSLPNVSEAEAGDGGVASAFQSKVLLPARTRRVPPSPKQKENKTQKKKYPCVFAYEKTSLSGN